MLCSVFCIQILYTDTVYRYFSRIGHYRVLSKVPCAIQWVFISYVLYTLVCMSQEAGCYSRC